MKHASIACLALALSVVPAQSNDYHYVSGYNGKAFTMEEIPGQLQVSFTADVSETNARNIAEAAGLDVLRMAQAGGTYVLARTEDESAVTRLASLRGVAATMPLLRDQEGFVKTFAPSELTVQFHRQTNVARQHEVISELGAGIVRRQRTPGYYTLTVPGDLSLFEAIRAFNEHPDVHFAELSAFGFDDALEIPDDPLFEDQWHLRNTGQDGGTPGADMEAVDGWDLFLGDENVVVSVVDTGIDWDHPDLAPRIVDIGDEDWDFESGPGKIPHDSGYHGTCCNGIAGAATDNGIGVSGVARGCRLMPLKVDLASGQNQNRADAINYAASRADDFAHIVLSMSWRMSSGDFTAVEAACQNALDAGLLTCVASGNDDGAITYPALYPTTIAVGATSPCDERKNPNSCDGEWWGSNYGPMLNVTAPGVKITTTTAGGGYTSTFNGTSSACPNAAGVLAMLWAAAPSMTNEEAWEVLELSAEDQVGPANEDTPGWDPYFGWGRVNLAEAIREAESRSGGVEGGVVDEFGDPLEGALVEGIEAERSTVTDSRGAFSLGLPPDQTHTVRASHYGLRTEEASIYVSQGEFEQILFRLSYAEDGSVAGRITDTDTGDPIEGAKVQLPETPVDPVYSDAMGRYSITAPGGAAYDMQVTALGYASVTFDEVAFIEETQTALNIGLDPFPEILILDLDPTPTSSTIQRRYMALRGKDVLVTTDLGQFESLAGFQVIMVNLGMSPNNFVLEADSHEAAALADYLDGGGVLYLEGGDFWAFDPETPLHSYFRIAGISDGDADLYQVDGVPGTPTRGRSYNYSGENSFVDDIAPLGSAVSIWENPADGWSCGVYFRGNYRTIGTSFEAGGLDVGSSDRLFEGLLRD